MLLFITVEPYRAWHLSKGTLLIRLCIHAARYIWKLMCHEVTTQGTVLLCQNSTSIVTLADRVTVTLSHLYLGWLKVVSWRHDRF